jgi:5-(carboxyamino)imidazole ribonucleotide mutase
MNLTTPKTKEPILVGVVMGSNSDWEVMSEASKILDEFQVSHECLVFVCTPNAR